MKTYLAAVALAAALPQPAAAITFSSLTTIYVASGVYSLFDADTAVHCSNVSGHSAQLRVLVLLPTGVVGASTTQTLAHGATITVATSVIAGYDAVVLAELGDVIVGVVNVEATQSAVFCTAHVVNQDAPSPTTGNPLHLVRVNPHPGTVE
jgi:hypothetical protein